MIVKGTGILTITPAGAETISGIAGSQTIQGIGSNARLERYDGNWILRSPPLGITA
jgi:hypothetical protein